jgi:ferritin-like metal-binding protein YciE
MSVKTMQDLFVNELRDIYHAEKQLVKALPKMAKAANSNELKQAIESHLEETRGQVERLEQVFESLDVAKRAKPCEAMEGLVSEGKEIIEEVDDPEVRDAGLIVAAQKVEHYEIASYGSLIAMAKQLGYGDAGTLLAQTLAEEKAADQKLSKLALSGINKKAGTETKPQAA